MNQEVRLASGMAFIGGGNMATALASGLMGKRCSTSAIHVIDPQAAALEPWHERGCSTAPQADERLAAQPVWVLAVKPQHMQEAVAQCRPFLQPETLIISIAAGLNSQTLGQWLGSAQQPWTRLIRGMPNTPALIGAGMTALVAGAGVSAADKAVVQTLFKAVGQFIWLDDEAHLDAVTALSGSGPAYVFLFIEALMEGGVALGLSAAQSRQLALATVAGATELAALSADSPAVLRERVTSRGGTTEAALRVFETQGWADTVRHAMQAAHHRAGQLGAGPGADLGAVPGA